MDAEDIEKKLTEVRKQISEEQEKGQKLATAIQKLQGDLQVIAQSLMALKVKEETYNDLLN